MRNENSILNLCFLFFLVCDLTDYLINHLIPFLHLYPSFSQSMCVLTPRLIFPTRIPGIKDQRLQICWLFHLIPFRVWDTFLRILVLVFVWMHEWLGIFWRGSKEGEEEKKKCSTARKWWWWWYLRIETPRVRREGIGLDWIDGLSTVPIITLFTSFTSFH